MLNLECKPESSIEFLKSFSPEHLWPLTAIYPKGIPGLSEREANIHTKTFLPEDYEECKKWIQAMNSRGWNIYFSINPPKKLLNKKAKKEDIAEIRWLYVDIDPRAGEPLEKEQARIKALLTTNLPAGIPKPTLSLTAAAAWGCGGWACLICWPILKINTRKLSPIVL
ncbi:MAG: hypothetical protein IPJ01_07770 [Micavibrio sp.]|nr:hypothetical protein [Micavibrio sp.]